MKAVKAATPPTVVLLSAAGTLSRVDHALDRTGVRLVRVRSMEPHPIDPSLWLGRLARRPRPDTVIVTSRHAVGAGVRPWMKIKGPFPRSVEFWAIGPATAYRLRRAGIHQVHTPDTADSAGILRALAASPKRRVAYLRSNLAGGQLVRALRAQGHRVTDAVVYKVEMPAPLTQPERCAILRADLLCVTSPSSLAGLATRIGRAAFARLAKGTPFVVLGERTRRAAELRHINQISVPPSLDTRPLARHVLREVGYARK